MRGITPMAEWSIWRGIRIRTEPAESDSFLTSADAADDSRRDRLSYVLS
jgi:hypothetical protein